MASRYRFSAQILDRIGVWSEIRRGLGTNRFDATTSISTCCCARLRERARDDLRVRGRDTRSGQELIRCNGQIRRQDLERPRKEGGNEQIQRQQINRSKNRGAADTAGTGAGAPDFRCRDRAGQKRHRRAAQAAPARRRASRPPSRTRRRASSSNGSSCAATATGPAASATSPSSPTIRAGQTSRCSASAPRRCSGSRMSSRRRR